MGECTHTSENTYGLLSGTGRGPKLWAGQLSITDADTLDTGFDTIEGCAFISQEAADIDKDSAIAWIKSITGGTIAFLTGEKNDYTNVETVAWGVVVGSKR